MVDKCEFGVDTTNFLGIIISPGGLRTDGAKARVIRDWPQPKKYKEVQCFLAFPEPLSPLHCELFGVDGSSHVAEPKERLLALVARLRRGPRIAQEIIHLGSYPEQQNSLVALVCPQLVCKRHNPSAFLRAPQCYRTPAQTEGYPCPV